ncbi:MAG: hypothetical protein HY690_08790 [Chloroflexi bacterium]|nr:hypothetical protein [Chloroflexota bacterium]
MPRLEKLSQAEVERLKRRKTRTQDLSQYFSYLSTLKAGDWGRVTLEPDESQRAIKRRLTTASKQRGVDIKYRYGKGEQGQIIFEVR